MVKKAGIILLLVVAAHCAATTGLSFAQQTECPPECVTDSLEIVTWYPSPYSEYEELRLYPTTRDANYCDNDKIGLLYYDDGGTISDSSDDKVKICKGTAEGWVELGGGFWQLSGNDILNTNPSGNVVILNGLRIGNVNTSTPGTIRFTGTDFEGFINGKWVSLTTKTNEFSTSQEFLTNGIFVVPTGIDKIKVRAWGGGGGGGSSGGITGVLGVMGESGRFTS